MGRIDSVLPDADSCPDLIIRILESPGCSSITVQDPSIPLRMDLEKITISSTCPFRSLVIAFLDVIPPSLICFPQSFNRCRSWMQMWETSWSSAAACGVWTLMREMFLRQPILREERSNRDGSTFLLRSFAKPILSRQIQKSWAIRPQTSS